MKRKELFWMLVPCLLLVVAGWCFSRRPDPFRMTIEEIKVLPVTPLEASKGYDTKVSFKTHIGGIPQWHNEPEFRSLHQVNVRLAYSKNGKTTELRFFRNGKEVFGRMKSQVTADKDQEEHVCLLRLAKVPGQHGQLNLNIGVHGEHFPLGKWHLARITPKTYGSVLLRRKGQIITAPRVSRKPPFGLSDITREWHNRGSKMLIQIYLLPNENDFPFSDDLLRNSHLENARFITEKGVTSAGYNGGSFKRAWNPNYDNRTIETYLWIEKRTYPSNCRNIVFKADVSIGNSWPLPIEVELRKNGKDIQPAKPKLPDNLATP